MNQFVMITGASKGLGRSLATIFAEYQHNVIIHGRDIQNLRITQEEVHKRGSRCCIVGGDLRDHRTLEELIQRAREYNIITLIHNAGADVCQPFEKISARDVEEVLTTDLLAPIYVSQEIYAMFVKRQEGTIIAINSIAGLENQNHRSLYCAARWGLRGFMDTLRLEATPHNIHLLSVYPSRIKTKPHFTYGMEPQYVAERIYRASRDFKIDNLILDERPEKFKKNE